MGFSWGKAESRKQSGQSENHFSFLNFYCLLLPVVLLIFMGKSRKQKAESSQGKARIISVFSISTVCFCPWFYSVSLAVEIPLAKRPFTISAFCFLLPVSVFYFLLSAFPLYRQSGFTPRMQGR